MAAVSDQQARSHTRLANAWRRVSGPVGDVYDRLPLFWGVLLINASILVAAVALLVVTPLTISYPIKTVQAIVLAAAVLVMVAVNAALLRTGLRPLLRVLHDVEEVELAPADPQRLPEVGGNESRAVARAVNVMLDRLDEERRQVSRRVLTALEGERRRVGQELHDEIGQRLTGILLELKPVACASPTELEPRITQIQDEVRATLDEVGQLAWQLRPSILDDLGLVAALDALLSGIDEHADLELSSSFPAQLPPLDPEVELAIFRIAQEAVTNAVRHADASQVEVALTTSHNLELHVSDDGRGVAGQAQAGPGIQGMRERALLIGADLQIDSPGRLGGVSVVLNLNLSPPAAGRLA
jgi:two-component system sensor histidine kinase UhpB